MKARGFTLIELLVVIAILAVLTLVGFANYLNSLKTARDARRKSDLRTIQTALETYFEDNNRYPDSIPTEGNSLCHPGGCSVASYLNKLPQDPSKIDYPYESDGTYFRIYSCIENKNDNGPNVNQDGYTPDCSGGAGGVCDPCKFGIASTNTDLQ